MNKYLLKTSKLLLCSLLTTASVSYTTPEHDHLTRVADVMHGHLRNTIEWSKDFLYSNQQFTPLAQRFAQHLTSFDNEVMGLLHTRSAMERGELTHRAKEIVGELKTMLNDMNRELASLVGSKSPLKFMATMQQAQSSMSSKLTRIEGKVRDFKNACNKHQAHRLHASLVNLERAIFEFKNNNNNAKAALMSRIQTTFTK